MEGFRDPFSIFRTEWVGERQDLKECYMIEQQGPSQRQIALPTVLDALHVHSPNGRPLTSYRAIRSNG